VKAVVTVSLRQGCHREVLPEGSRRQISALRKTILGKHLTCEERIKIEAYKDLGYSSRKISHILGRALQTINNAVNQGTVRTIKQRQVHNDKVHEYDQSTYSADADH